jgi:hypothetical protein
MQNIYVGFGNAVTLKYEDKNYLNDITKVKLIIT